jgi:sigma-E factor negative regulatory protein RseA
MTEKLRQSLSAVIDDEADAFELRRVLDELGRDPELRGLWERYHLIGNALRGECAALPAALPDRVWRALEAADNVAPVSGGGDAAVASASAGPAGAAQPWRMRAGRMTGLAVAASVAFAVVLGFNTLSTDDPGAVPQIAGVNDPAVSRVPAAQGATQPGATGQRADSRVADAGIVDSRVNLAAEISPSDVRRAQAYILHHTQQQALNQPGVMSFVKMATYEAP